MKLIAPVAAIWDGSPNCPSHPAVRVEILRRPSQANFSHEPTWHMELVAMASHTGSHLDAPLHKMPGGAAIDQMPLESSSGQPSSLTCGSCRRSRKLRPRTCRARCSVLRRRDRAARDRLGRQTRAKSDERGSTARRPGLDGARAVWSSARCAAWDSITTRRGALNLATHTRTRVFSGSGVWIIEELRFPEDSVALEGRRSSAGAASN
jgi:kynurenine formamidase